MNDEILVGAFRPVQESDGTTAEVVHGWLGQLGNWIFIGGILSLKQAKKINSWTDEARIMRGSMRKVPEVWSAHEKARVKSKDPLYKDGRIIVVEGHLGLKADMVWSTRIHLAPYGLDEVELQHKGHSLDAGGALHVPLAEKKEAEPGIAIAPVGRYSWRQEKSPCGLTVRGHSEARARRLRRGTKWKKRCRSRKRHWSSSCGDGHYQAYSLGTTT